jgi:ABC-type sugar transport system permease subunit
MRPERSWIPYLFVAPAGLLFAVFVLGPTAATAALAFTDWDWPHAPRWAGLENFTRLWRDDFIFHRALWNNVVYLVLSLASEVGLALALALALERQMPGRRILRALFFTPMVLPLVLVGFLFRFILRAGGGLVNAGLGSIGFAADVDWLADRRFAMLSIAAISGWVYFGYFLILIEAGLARLPRELIEAALLETGSAWKRFVHVRLPLLRDVLAVCVLLCATGAFRAFDLFYVLGGRSGGPGHITEIVPTWLVQQAFELKRYGYGCAIACALVAIVGGIVFAWVLGSGRRRLKRRLEF